jgi:hypothetical protein
MDADIVMMNESEFQKKSFTIADDILNEMNGSFNKHLSDNISTTVRAQAIERISGVILWTWINTLRQMNVGEDKIKQAVSYLVNFSLTQHVIDSEPKAESELQ